MAPRPHADETFLSWLQRLMYANDLSRDMFLEEIAGERLSPWEIALLGDQLSDLLLERLSRLCDLEAAAIQKTLTQGRWWLALDSFTICCPACWREDISLSPEARHTRLSWGNPLLQVCPRHNQALIDLPQHLGSLHLLQYLSKPEVADTAYQPSAVQAGTQFLASLDEALATLDTDDLGYPPAFRMLEDIMTCFARRFGPHGSRNTEQELRFHIADHPRWRESWDYFFGEAPLDLLGEGMDAKSGRFHFLKLERIQVRRLYLLCALYVLGDWGKEPHPVRYCFSKQSWRWLQTQSRTWSPKHLEQLRPIAQKVAW